MDPSPAIFLTMRRPTLIAVAFQVLTAGYLQLVEWVDLFPWNNLSKGNQQEKLDLVILTCQAGVAIWFVRERLWRMALGWTAYAVWLYLQFASWWSPYLFGGRTVGPTWYFTHTYKFLPQIGQRPTPDANHIVLQLLLIAVLLTGAIAIARVTVGRWPARNSQAAKPD